MHQRIDAALWKLIKNTQLSFWGFSGKPNLISTKKVKSLKIQPNSSQEHNMLRLETSPPFPVSGLFERDHDKCCCLLSSLVWSGYYFVRWCQGEGKDCEVHPFMDKPQGEKKNTHAGMNEPGRELGPSAKAAHDLVFFHTSTPPPPTFVFMVCLFFQGWRRLFNMYQHG